jgi:hypothetical protein
MTRRHHGQGCAGQNMLPLIQAFANIALRRQGPEDLPASRFLLLLALTCYCLLQFAVSLPYYAGFTSGLVRSVILDLILLSGTVWGLLRFTGRPARFRQTLTALVGTGAMLNLLLLPFSFWYELGVVAGQARLIPTVGIIAVVIWSVTVNGHILSRAMSTPFVVGLAVAVAYFLLNVLIISRAAPVTT